MRVTFWGTYDKGKPRIRIIIQGLKENGCNIVECHTDIWKEIEDKSRLQTWPTRLRLALKWLCSYPRLIWRYLRLSHHDAVVVGYLGNMGVLLLWPFSRFRGIPLVWDAFIPLYEAVVDDRKLLSRYHPLAYFLWVWDWLACRAADLVLFDTKAHADYFVKTFGMPSNKTAVAFVGAEKDLFTPTTSLAPQIPSSPNTTKVLFYGQFIPLHGIETIIGAAQLLEEEQIKWILIGQGQQEKHIRRLLRIHPLPKLEWVPWVPYFQLNSWIHQADICLGIFGTSKKADRVIPNKVFQVIACRKPLITRDSAAIRELLDPTTKGIFLIPPGDPEALAETVLSLHSKIHLIKDPGKVPTAISPYAIGNQVLRHLKALLESKS